MNHESADPRSEAADRFRASLASLPVDDGDDLIRYLSLAARLAVLGDPGPLADWTKRAQRRVDAVQAIEARVAELERELLEGEGEFLGLAVCLVQDLRIAVGLDTSDFLRPASDSVVTLAELADEIPLDDEAAGVVAGYAELIPVPQPLRLGHVDRPVGLGAIAALAAGLAATEDSRTRIVRLERRDATAAVPDEELALCEGVAPAESLRRRFEERHAAMGTLDGNVHVSAWARLRDDWSMAISLRIKGGDGSIRPVAVRVGTRIAEPDEDADGSFLVELAALSPVARSRMLVDPIVVTLSDGRRVSF